MRPPSPGHRNCSPGLALWAAFRKKTSRPTSRPPAARQGRRTAGRCSRLSRELHRCRPAGTGDAARHSSRNSRPRPSPSPIQQQTEEAPAEQPAPSADQQQAPDIRVDESALAEAQAILNEGSGLASMSEDDIKGRIKRARRLGRAEGVTDDVKAALRDFVDTARQELVSRQAKSQQPDAGQQAGEEPAADPGRGEASEDTSRKRRPRRRLRHRKPRTARSKNPTYRRRRKPRPRHFLPTTRRSTR